MSHGGAFKRFKGLTAPLDKYRHSSEPYQGIPCIHSKHSANTVWRDGLTHACLLCNDNISKGSIGFSLDRLTHPAQLKARKFWAKVDFSSLDDCWQWTAPKISSYIAFTWDRRPIRTRFIFHPIHVATWLTWGDIGRSATVSLCGHRRCVNPLHNIPSFLDAADISTLVDRQALELDYQLLRSQLSSSHEQVINKLASTSNPLRLEHHSLVSLPDPTSDFTSRYEQALFARDESLVDQTHQLFME